MSANETQCAKCEYEWDYNGKMPIGAMVTCPACLNKTELEESEEVEA